MLITDSFPFVWPKNFTFEVEVDNVSPELWSLLTGSTTILDKADQIGYTDTMNDNTILKATTAYPDDPECTVVDVDDPEFMYVYTTDSSGEQLTYRPHLDGDSFVYNAVTWETLLTEWATGGVRIAPNPVSVGDIVNTKRLLELPHGVIFIPEHSLYAPLPFRVTSNGYIVVAQSRFTFDMFTDTYGPNASWKVLWLPPEGIDAD